MHTDAFIKEKINFQNCGSFKLQQNLQGIPHFSDRGLSNGFSGVFTAAMCELQRFI